jgi:hypothetical protein
MRLVQTVVSSEGSREPADNPRRLAALIDLSFR